MGYDLWPRPYRLQSFAGGLMRISQEIRRGVVFIGLCDPSTNNFEAKGTGFFERYDEWVYLVTVQHIAAGLGDSPFAIRINKRDGSSANIHVDPLMGGAKWYSNLDDGDVDLAVMPATFDMPERGELDLLAIRSVIFAHAELLSKLPIGVGDMCYAVGIVPTDGRKRPQLAGRSHWEHCPDAGRRTYLVEMQNLKGLSGSPVFVRPSRSIDLSVPGQDSLIFRLGKDNVLLLGVWQSSWDAEPGEVFAAEKGKQVRVPVGIGTVVPTDELIRLLEMPDLRRLRDESKAAQERAQASAPDLRGT